MAKNRNLPEASNERNLPQSVAAKYDLHSNHNAGPYYFNGHKVQLDQINLKQADDLVKKGFPYLVLKPPASKDSAV